jgi:hypothetical protein
MLDSKFIIELVPGDHPEVVIEGYYRGNLP